MPAPTVTFADLLNDFAAELNLTRLATVGTVPNDLWTQRAVNFLNRSLRWAWSDDDQRFIWPQTLTNSSTVPITNNIIAWSDVSFSDWVSFWQTDPRVAPTNVFPILPYWGWALGNAVAPVPVSWDGTQFNVQSGGSPATIFAFFRTPVPQGTFALAASSPTYATPTLPDFFRDAVVKYALAEYYATTGSAQEQDYRARAVDWYDSNKAAITNSDAAYPWQGNVITT